MIIYKIYGWTRTASNLAEINRLEFFDYMFCFICKKRRKNANMITNILIVQFYLKLFIFFFKF